MSSENTADREAQKIEELVQLVKRNGIEQGAMNGLVITACIFGFFGWWNLSSRLNRLEADIRKLSSQNSQSLSETQRLQNLERQREPLQATRDE